jgi:sugar phosphate isomerase/epimerase
MGMDRRDFLTTSASAALVSAADGAKTPAREIGLGASTSTAGIRHRNGKFGSSVIELEYYKSLGASGAQIGVRSWADGEVAKQVRAKAEELEMYLEGQIGLPKDEGDLDRFDAQVAAAKESGVEILRTVMLSGRRYETFETLESWNAFRERSWKSLTLAEPVAAKHGVKLALENHKDWQVDEQITILKKLSSEHVGINLDTGNNISLLENPMEVVEALAPFSITTHLKDMAVEETQDGFLLAEVPLGEGFLDIPEVIEICLAARPEIRFNLEMITRDPLRIPCLTEQYWTTFGERRAHELAAALRMVRANQVDQPLPRISGKSKEEQIAIEEENNKRCFAWAAERGL